ncbi:M56 family metallopeptidase [Duncaniella muris]|uniref:M56 family peptidase n=2 Tax=Duncaniella muris TaxID=2094150 RepID=A0A2V1IR84_9BACT|nr:M56 family metallopeptidase [Duncaniella muris]PWB03900.1 M56 family peptidase [Duncaniella muris]
MGILFSYSLYSSILLSLLYLSYKWVLAGENQHAYNRTALWLICLVALLGLPLSRLAASIGADAPAAVMPEIEMGQIQIGLEADESAGFQPLWLTAVLWIYLSGVVLTAMQTLLIASRLWRIISAGETVREGRYKIILTDDRSIAPFSWWRYVVMSRSDWNESGRMILTHELKHLSLHHWIDLAVAQIISIFQWYNPSAWLMREEFKTVHEYQADKAVLESGIPARDYQMLLIKKAVGARFPSLANSLNHSKLKKCITMMYNQNSSASRRLRGLALVPALAAAIAVTNIDAVAAVLEETSAARFLVEETSEPVAAEIRTAVSGLPSTESSAVSTREVSEKTQDSQMSPATVSVHTDNAVAAAAAETLTAAVSEGDKPSGKAAEKADAPESVYSVVQKKPEFPGGDAAVLQYISDNIHYPKEARDKKIQGRVVVRFVINKDGSVGETSVLRSADPLLDKEAMRVVSTLPAFKPGEVDGKPVSVYYVLPIGFSLKDDAGKENSDKPVVKVKSVDGKQVADVDGRKEEVKVYVDGKLYEGNLADIDPSKIESMTVDKSKEGVIRIEMKK